MSRPAGLHPVLNPGTIIPMGTDQAILHPGTGSRSASARPTPSVLERRAFPRQPIPDDADTLVTLHGIDDDGNHLDFGCEPVNVSRGGLLARCDRKMPPGSPCVGQFRFAGGKIAPNFAVGKVVRLQDEPDGFLIALEFDEPLQTVALSA